MVKASYTQKITSNGIHFSIDQSDRTSHEMKSSHFHDNYEIYYLIYGERNYLIGDRTYKVSPGDLVFIRPNEIHRTTNTSVPFHERFSFNFNKPFLGQDAVWLEDEHSPFITDTHLISLPIHVQKKVEELLNRMVSEYLKRDKGFETMIRAALIELLIISSRCNREMVNKPFEFASSTHQKISEIVQYINEHYEQPLTLESLAAHFYISPYYLSRLFKKTTGFTYVEYVMTARIKAAQRLLRETKWKVSRIMQDVGFRDTAHFGKVFKKLSNCTPLQYRKMYQKI